MKRPNPQIPKNVPEGTTWFGGPIEWFSISLQIRGDDLIPEEVTALLGREPDRCGQKGMPIHRKDGSLMRISKSGFWSVDLKPLDTDEWDCGEAMIQLLMRLPADPLVWAKLSARFKISFFVGLRMTAKNKGLELSPEALSYLGNRRISAGFDIYFEEDGPAADRENSEP